MPDKFFPPGFNPTGFYPTGFFPDEVSDDTDTTPDAFEFADQFNVPTGSVRTSNVITVSGINEAANISVSGSTTSAYSINGSSFVSTGGTVVNGDGVRVRHTASGSASTAVSSSLSIGGVSDTFTSTTASTGGVSSFGPLASLIQRRRLFA